MIKTEIFTKYKNLSQIKKAIGFKRIKARCGTTLFTIPRKNFYVDIQISATEKITISFPENENYVIIEDTKR